MLPRFERARAIFYDALDIPEGERPDFLRRTCGDDAILLSEVEQLLDYHGRSGDLLDAVEDLPAALGQELRAGRGGLPGAIGRYRLIRLIGQGGMGVVYQAEAPDGRLVAIKLLRTALLAPEAVTRLRREARALQALRHPLIPRFIEAGVERSGAEEVPYLVMEYVEGRELSTFIAQAHPEPAVLFEILAASAEAVQHAHDHGIIHRDLKPSNILVESDPDRPPRPRVIDFGVARFVAFHATGTTFQTRSGALVGTIGYMSPEHLAAGVLTRRSDVYSLGVITYEALAGRLPYDLAGDSVLRCVFAILHTPAAPLPREAGSRAINEVLQRALEKNPSDRFATAQEFAEALRRAYRGERAPLTLGAAVRRWKRLTRKARTRAIALAALLAVAAVALATISIVRDQAERRGVDQKLRALYTFIDETDTMRHGPGLTLSGARSCIDAYDRADSILATLPHRPFFTDLRAYLVFRKGELLYMIGANQLSGDTLNLASLNWHRVWGMVRQPGALREMKGHKPLAMRLAALSASTGQGSDALVHRFLARMDRPRYEYTWERHRSSGALEDMLKAGTNAWFFIPSIGLGSPQALSERSSEDIASAHAGVGIALTNLGTTVDSLPAIDEALRAFATADTSRIYREKSDRASVARNVGRAHLVKAELTGSQADLDSALASFHAARYTRGGPAQALLTKTALSEAYRVGARISSSADSARVRMERALRLWRSPGEAAAFLEDPYLCAAAFLEEASVHTESAELRGAGSPAVHVARASACLDSVAICLRRDREPAFYARYLLSRARLESTRWRLWRETAAREAALGDLDESLLLLPPSESPRHARLVREERERLDAVRPAAGPMASSTGDARGR